MPLNISLGPALVDPIIFAPFFTRLAYDKLS